MIRELVRKDNEVSRLKKELDVETQVQKKNVEYAIEFLIKEGALKKIAEELKNEVSGSSI